MGKKIVPIDHIEEDVYKNLFYIGYFDGDFPVQKHPHRHSYYQILWLIEGNGVHVLDDKRFKLSDNELFLISDGQVHYFEKARAITGYLLCFKDELWPQPPNSLNNYKTSLFNHLLISPYFKLSNEQIEELSILFQSMLREYLKTELFNRTELFSAYLKILLIKLEHLKTTVIIKNSKDNNDYRLFYRFIDLLETGFKQHHDIASFARDLSVSTRKLSAICSQYTGKNAKELINERIIIEGKRLLQFTTYAVKEIADILGFADQYQYSKFFKKHVLKSPLDYRNTVAWIDI